MLSKSRTSLVVVEEGNHVSVTFPEGIVLAESNVQEVEQQLLALVEGRDRVHLSLDLGGVALLTSVVLGKFLALNGKVRAAGGRLTLVNLSPEVRMVFKVTRLDTILEIHTNPETLSA